MQFHWTVTVVLFIGAQRCVLPAAILPSGSPTILLSTEGPKPSLDSDFPTIHKDTPQSKPSDGVLPTIHEDGLPFALKDLPTKSPIEDPDLPEREDAPSQSDSPNFPSPMEDPDQPNGEDTPSQSDLPYGLLHSPMEAPDVFEGDLAIPQEMINEYYEEVEPTNVSIRH